MMPSTGKCVVCNGNITGVKYPGLQCQGNCKKLFHYKCTSPSEDIDIEAIDTVHWKCNNCLVTPSVTPQLLSFESSISFPEINVGNLVNDKILFQFLSDLKKVILQVHDSQQFICSQLDDLKKQNSAIIKENTELKKNLEYEKNLSIVQQKRINEMEANIDDFKQNELINNVVISGLPELSEPQMSDIFEIISCKINAEVKVCDVLSFKKTVIKSKNQSLITVNFKSQKAKTEFMSKKKAFKQLTTLDLQQEDKHHFTRKFVRIPSEIFFRDNITPFKSKLYQEAKKIKNELKFQYLWFKNNSIFLRKEPNSKVYRLHSNNDLEFISNIFKSTIPVQQFV